jgi:MFS transporter, UMF1 family
MSEDVGSPIEDVATDNKAIFGWCLYDFANSAFTTMVVTFVYATFFAGYIVGIENEGTTIWSWGVAATAIVVAILSPFMGAIADRGGYRKLFLTMFTAICIVSTIATYWAEPFSTPAVVPGMGGAIGALPRAEYIIRGDIWMALILFVIANIAFEMGGVFYNAFLPDLAPQDKIGRISGYGWALGYVGGLIVLALCLVLFIWPAEPFFGLVGKENFEHIRATNIFVALWFLVFSIPILLWVKEDKSTVTKDDQPLISTTIKQLKGTFKELRKYKEIMTFLISRLLFNDGIVTIFFFGGLFAAAEYGFTTQKLMYFGALLNVTAAIGAFGLGFLDDILGGKKTILITLGALSICAMVVLAVDNETVFWIAGACVGIFVGPNQASSRALMGRFVPPDKENEFYGFFALSGKATAFLGPMLFGLLTAAFDSQRVGLTVVVFFFIIGGAILSFVDEEKGIALAGRNKAKNR